MIDPIIEPVQNAVVDRDPINGRVRLALCDPAAPGRFALFWLMDEAASKIGAGLTAITGGAPAAPKASIVDCPDCVWSDFGATGGLPAEFVKEYRALIDRAGTELVRRPLIDAWRRRGYRITLLSVAECRATPDEPEQTATTAEGDAVRQEAVDAITPEALIHEADLVEQLVAWHRAHPAES